MNTRPYKEYQKLYNELVRKHSDDFAEMDIVIEEELVENALKYFDQPVFPLIYPAKSYAVAIIYAACLYDHYGYDMRESLDDPDLFLGQDPYFVRYGEAKETYEQILDKLQFKIDWINKGWAPQTVQYFEAECTLDGLQRTLDIMDLMA